VCILGTFDFYLVSISFSGWVACLFVWFAPILTSCNKRTELWLVQRGHGGAVSYLWVCTQCSVFMWECLSFICDCVCMLKSLLLFYNVLLKMVARLEDLWSLRSLPLVHIASIWFSFAGSSWFILLTFRCLRQNK